MFSARQSSRKLSMSSISSSPSSASMVFWKNLVGGSCSLSPAMMAAFALPSDPMALLVVIWDDSSKTTRSNLG